jgi:hypothetical protein
MRRAAAGVTAALLAASLLSGCTIADQGCGGVERAGGKSSCETDRIGNGGPGGVGGQATPPASPSQVSNTPAPADAPSGTASP